jgi:type III pantothenate kinase
MLLALDLGNTSLSAAVFDGKRIVRRFYVPVGDFNILAARFEEDLGPLLGEIDHVGLASVNPPMVYAVQGALHTVLASVKVIVVGRDVKVPIRAMVKRPEEVGVDRLLDALAAFRRVAEACLVADFGTALTVDVVSSEGDYLGGVIAPGVGMSASALHTGTALLPEVRPEAVQDVIGKDTVSCMQSGLFWGTVGMVEGLVARIKQEYPPAKKVLATGGYAGLFAGRCPVIDEIVPELTLEGIRLTLEGETKR